MKNLKEKTEKTNTYKMFTLSKRSPLYIYDVEKNEFYQTSKAWEVSEILPCEGLICLERLHSKDPKDLTTVEAADLVDAKYKWVGFQISKRDARNKENEVYRRARKDKMNELLELSTIPTTVENLSLVLEYLNSKNWGSWELPRMSIGYKAHQYNCEGTQVTTITLSRPIVFCGKPEKYFKSTTRRGFLEKYNAI